MNMYKESFKRPFKYLREVLIGGLYTLISGLPVISLFAMPYVQGYVLEAAKHTFEGKDELPKWGLKKSDGSWPVYKKWCMGVGAGVVYLAYLLPAIVLGLIIVKSLSGVLYMTFFEIMSSSNPFLGFWSVISSSGVLVYAIIGVVFALIATVIAPAAILTWVRHGKFKKAFDFKEIFKKVFAKKYISVWLLTVIFMILIQVVVQALALGLAYLGGAASSRSVLAGFAILLSILSAYVQFVYRVIVYTLYVKAIK